jgi:uncharacterized protein YkwD
VARPSVRIVLASAAAVLAVLAVLAAAFAPVPAAAGTAARATELSLLESDVLAQINFIRVQHDLAPLRLNAELGEAAEEHSQEMAADGYFQHDSSDGSVFWKRIADFYSSAGYGYWSVGENLLWGSPNVGPVGALQLWMRSPEHRANILDPRWREIGISAVHTLRAPGTYRDRTVTIITTDFGVRH